MTVLFLSFSFNAFSQKAAGEALPPSFKIKMSYPTGIVHIYKISDTTNVSRKYSDSSVRKFNRYYDFYMTQRSPSAPEKGFLKIDCSMDSLFYKFTEGEASYEFNSQADAPGAISFEDLTANLVPLGKDFTMTYSPYNEVASIEGEKLDWLKNYVLEQGAGHLDTLKTFVWLDGISFNTLKYLADVKKLVLPEESQMIDSLWTSPISFRVNGMNYYDTAIARISDITDGAITIEAKLNNIKPLPDMGRFYGISGQLLPIVGCEGKGIFTLKLAPRGSIKSAELITNLKIKVKIHNDIFTEQIQSKVTWDLLHQYKYD